MFYRVFLDLFISHLKSEEAEGTVVAIKEAIEEVFQSIQAVPQGKKVWDAPTPPIYLTATLKSANLVIKNVPLVLDDAALDESKLSVYKAYLFHLLSTHVKVARKNKSMKATVG